ncbi:MFS general substrate transporter [Macrolepiota fuliginosa MF-IS2]|uniref:MFS general substrate transporter n=1 Tax=Macrolepiota fuliginosa MF-IS2 TaxID=1400762 RepID=A0A9P5X280_9AGAR|nr:MFS general substrate transporter [Macrolepiota fuliginosa MF-IS2]
MAFRPAEKSATDGLNERSIISSSSSSEYGTLPPSSSKHLSRYYVPSLEYTSEEEADVVRILDRRLFPFILLTTFVLNMDRTNHSNAVSDNMPGDLGFTIDTVGTAAAMSSVLFATFCLSGSILAKLVGPHRWIPLLMFAWGVVTLLHATIQNKAQYLTIRCWISITEGGVIPATLVYFGTFYKSTELATRLAWFWGVQHIASALSGVMAYFLFRLPGMEGWRWLFLVDGIWTVIVAALTWFYLPQNLENTRGGLRGRLPWFTDRELKIAVTRIIKDDLSKSSYEQRVRWSDVKETLSDPAIWGHMFITSIGHTPQSPLHIYLPTIIKSFNFDVFVANALTAPPYLLQTIFMILLVRSSDRRRERGYHGSFAAGWQLVGWVWLRFMPGSANRYTKYLAAVFVASWPSNHPLNIAWLSENAETVGKKTVASGLIIGSSNIYGLWGSQIYKADDAPDFRRGNTINIVFALAAFLLWFYQKALYKRRNTRNWEAGRLWLTGEEREQDQVKQFTT